MLCAGEPAGTSDAVIDVEHVLVPEPGPPRGTQPLVPYREAKARFELEYFAELMRTAGGNVSRAARLGGKTRKEIYEALRRCGLAIRPAPAGSRGRRA